MAPRVLYLHGLRGGPDSERHRLLEAVFGSENVRAPDLRTRITLIMYTTLFIIFIGGLISAAICAFLYWSILGASFLSLLLCVLGCLVYILTGRGVTYYMVQKAVMIAEKEFKEFRPNVIVASSFGAVIVLAMEVSKVALVLLAPAQDSYCRYMRIKEYPSLIDYPYAIIIHGGADDSINLDDSIRLVETSGYGNCKLEVIDDDHSLNTLSEGDFKEFVDEAYEKGRETVMKMKREDIERSLKKSGRGSNVLTIDPTLFDIENVLESPPPLVKPESLQAETAAASGDLSPFTESQEP